MTVLSGTVTSSIITALSLQAPVLVDAASVPGVPGVVVVDVSAVVVDGVSVGKDTLCRVGGKVDVTNRTGVFSTGCGAILMQDVNKKARRIVKIFLTIGLNIRWSSAKRIETTNS